MTIFITPQIQCAPSIRYDQINANHRPEPSCLGHGKSGGIQLHSMDLGFARYGLVMRCIEGANGRRIWQAIDKSGQVIAAHPKHSGCALIAHATLNGA